MKLTGAQVSLLRIAVDRYLGNIASRDTPMRLAMEELVDDFGKVLPSFASTTESGASTTPITSAVTHS